MILGMLGDFEFKMNKAEFNQISKQIDFGWVSSDRIANYSKHQVATKPKTSFSISGSSITSPKGKKTLVMLFSSRTF